MNMWDLNFIPGYLPYYAQKILDVFALLNYECPLPAHISICTPRIFHLVSIPT